MFEGIYEWLRNLSFYLILVTAVTHVLPGNGYKKYIHFFTGLVLISMLLMPVLDIFNKEVKVNEIYERFYEEIENDIRGENDLIGNGHAIEKREDDKNRNNDIEVEEIVIGP